MALNILLLLVVVAAVKQITAQLVRVLAAVELVAY
jgi:hypothetical protein